MGEELPQGFNLVSNQPVPTSGDMDSLPRGFQLESQKYGTMEQQTLAGMEGVAEGLAGPLAPAAERMFGVSPEGIRGRAEANPWTHGIGEAAGFGLGMLGGTGEAQVLAKAGGAAANALKLGGESAGVLSKLAAGAVKASTEMGLFQAGDEATKAVLSDPNQTVGSAATNIGLSALLGGALSAPIAGTSAALHKVVDSGVLKEFADRMAFRGSGINPNEMIEKEFNNAISTYHAMNDELLGPAGLKSQAMARALPTEITPKILEQANTVSTKANQAIEQMTKKRVPDRYIDKFSSALNDFQEVATNPEATAAQHFDALNSFKRELQDYSKGNWGPFAIPSYHEAYDFLKITKNLGHDVRMALEDSATWGKAAELQRAVNKSWTDVLPAVKDAQSKFMTKVEGEFVPDPQKFLTYTRQGSKSTSQTIRQQMMGNFVDAMDGHFNAMDKLYDAAGVENPFPHPGMGALKESLDRPSLGSRMADLWYDRIGPTGAGETMGGATGLVAGNATGIPGAGIAGAYLGKWVLGPVYSSVIKGIMEKGASLPAYRAATSWAKNVIEGNAKLTNAAANLFRGGAMTIPSHFWPDHKEISRLDDGIDHASNDPRSLFNVSGNVGQYFPQHAQAISQHAMGSVMSLKGQKPQAVKPGNPLDAEIKPSKAQQAAYHRALTIAQQPLVAIQHIKDGTLLPRDVETIKSVYPQYYMKMSQELTNAMINHVNDGGKIPYKTRQSLSLFLGQPVDSTMTPQSIMATQNVFAQNKAAAQQEMAQGKTKKGTSKLGKLSEGLQTLDQARAGRSAKG